LNSRSTLLDLRVVSRPLGVLASFEAVFILFLISVIYKGDSRFLWFPIDSTIIFFVLGIAMGLVIIWREGIYLPGLAIVSLLMLFIAWVLLTALWTPSDIYAQEKLFKLATLNLWSVIATAMIIANRRERVRRFLLLLLVFGMAGALDCVIQYSSGAQYAAAVETLSTNEAFSASFRLANYLGYGRLFGMGAIVAFAAWLQTRPASKRGVSLMAVFAICWFGLLVVGSRGPTLSVLAGMMLPVALGLRFAGRRLLANRALVASVAFLAVLVGMSLYGIVEYSENLRTLQRLNIFVSEEGGGQTHRLSRWTGSWPLWFEQPVFGSGVGSWPVRFYGIDISWHPHNLILEVLVEFGLIGLLLLAGFGVVAARRTSVRRLREDPLMMCAAMLCINTFFYALTSSDITENRYFFAMMGLLVMRPYGRSSHVSVQSSARNLGPSGRPHSDLRQGVPDTRGGRV
jgi:O-antigen ligase